MNSTALPSASDSGRDLGRAIIATAIIDRLLYHSAVINTKGESYRLRDKQHTGLIKSYADRSGVGVVDVR